MNEREFRKMLRDANSYSEFYQAILALIGGDMEQFLRDGDEIVLQREPYIPLFIRNLGLRRVSIAHHAMPEPGLECDQLCDPEVVFEIKENVAIAEPLSWRNDYAGIETQVYIYDEFGEKTHIKPKARASIVSFCRTWFWNMSLQGFHNFKIDYEEGEE